ncbi:MAG: DUF3048 domain-containing protein [Clostridia bacterium]|nr:DUF3048 domain-containing protein [Clostridia bacterium]
MFKKVLAIMLCLSLVMALAGCSLFKHPDDVEASSVATVSKKPETEKKVVLTNPLTGLNDLKEDNADARPVAIMVNNITQAQAVQTGLGYADIVYETEVEGGVTRLMAVFKNLKSAKQIGSVRSARYPYVDLALGHNAIYVHCGQDPTYCAPHLKDIDDMSVDTNSTGAKRIKNGLSSEHTLYVFGNELWPALASKFKSTETNTPWQNFAPEKETVTLSGGAADRITIPFPILKTVFKFDAKTGLYTRYSKDKELKDYVTGESIKVKNVFVLLTAITDYPDGKHRRVDLTGGDGFYATNGTVMPIKWQKGGATASIKITDTNGKDIKVSAGKSWVCIPNKSTCTPIFEGQQTTTTTTGN